YAGTVDANRLWRNPMSVSAAEAAALHQAARQMRRRWHAWQDEQVFPHLDQARLWPVGPAGLFAAAELHAPAPDRLHLIALESLGQDQEHLAYFGELRAAALGLLASAATPGHLLTMLNELLPFAEAVPVAAAWAAVWDAAEEMLVWSAAGWGAAFRLPRDAPWQRLAGMGPILGLLPNAHYEEHQLNWRPGERLFIGSLAYCLQTDEPGPTPPVSCPPGRFELEVWLHEHRGDSPRALIMSLSDAWASSGAAPAAPFAWTLEARPS
ncbi:MAG TPA: SpoIIE family protein phosphatase, partial [Gemmatales bacterium]|nr:SpoIIE family protein phosphatase [Gemmatales bacterium]